MKKHYVKKFLSLVLSLLMLLTVIPFTAVPAAAATGTINNKSWAIISSNAGREVTSSGGNGFTICSDGQQDSTTVGFLDFDISSLTAPVESATLNLDVWTVSSTNGEAVVEIFSIDPEKRPKNGSTYITGKDSSKFSEIFGSSGFAYRSAVNANNAKNALGVYHDGKSDPAIGVIQMVSLNGGNVVQKSIDISYALNKAISAGQKDLCLAFLNPHSYNSSSNIWSDINIRYTNPTITYTSSSSTSVPFSAAVTLYKGSQPRGTNSSQTICSDGSNTNTTAVFVKFDISSIPETAASVSFETSAWRAGSSNQNAVADVYSIDPSKAPGMTAGQGDQTQQNYDDAFGTGTPNINGAKSYFGATTSLGTIATKDISSTASKVSLNITSAVRAAKAEGRSELCLMLVEQANYNGSDSKGWSDIYINPQQTNLVYSESAGGFGGFGSGLYYVKLTVDVVRTWNNAANKAWACFYYQRDNGTNAAEEHIDVAYEPGTFSGSTGERTLEYILPGFPTRVQFDCTGIDSSKEFEAKGVKLEVGPAAGVYEKSLDFKTVGSIWKLAYQNQNTRVTILGDLPNSNYPYAKTFDWIKNPENTFVPYSGANNVTAAVVAKDQYGVMMGTEYSATVQKYDWAGFTQLDSGVGFNASKSFTGDFSVSVSDSAKVANIDYFTGLLVVSVEDANDAYGETGSALFSVENQKEKVTLDPAGGTLSKDSYLVYYGSQLNADMNKKLNGNVAYPPTATRDGYTFKGFYNNGSGGTRIEDNATVLSNTTYYAQWDLNIYTVTFLDSDGNVYKTQNVRHGQAATAPVTPPKKAYDSLVHYNFIGWNKTFNVVTQDLEVSPVFLEEEHNLTHDSSKDIAATCTTEEQLFYSCSCGYSEFRTGAPANGHSWKESSRISAGCETEGTIYFDCENCSETRSETIPETGHSYVETVITEPTCVAAGTKKFICSVCKKTDPAQGGDDGIEIPALGHDWTDWEVAKESTCDEDGLRRRLCNRSGCEYSTKYYTEVINRTGHNWSTEIFTEASTCVKQGRTYKKCLNNCEATLTVETLELAEHTLGDWTTDVEPTCLNAGSKVQICSVCSKQFNRTAVDALGHDYQNYTKISDATCTEPAKEKGICSRCNAADVRSIAGSNALGHEFLDENYKFNNDAGCETDGTATAKCTRCAETDTRTAAGTAIGHKFTQYQSDNNATCENDGTRTALCDHGCGAKDTVADPGSKKNHTVESFVYNNDATCTENGTKTGTCSACGKDITVTADGTKIPHAFTNYSFNTNASCLENATEIASCDYGCGATDVRTVAGTKGEHTFPDPETERDKYTSNNDATCTEKGTMSAYCSVCHVARKTVADPDSVPTHKIVNWVSDGNATCTEDGTKHGSCVFGCGYKEENVPDKDSALGHWFRDYKLDNNATCTKDGTRTATCERKDCGETETITAKNTALGHSWSEWEFVDGVNTVDCTTGGTMERICTRDGCDASETMDVAPLGHSYVWVTVKEADAQTDCTKGYYKIKECSVCHAQDEASKVEVAGGAHNFVVSEYVAPTCSGEGKRVVSCSVCNTVYSQEILPKTDHIDSTLDESTVKKATCVAPGYTGDYTCNACGVVVRKGEVIPTSSEHVYTTYVITSQATCTDNAIETASCAVCGKEPVTREVVSSALGHSFTNYTLDGNATCTGVASKTAKCDRCDATDTVLVYGTALGHDWSEWIVTKEATCSSKGEAEKHCLRDKCDVTVTKELRQLSHAEGEWITDKEPTCEEEGHRYKECVGGCGAVLREETIPANGHSFEVSENTATCIDSGYLTYTCTVCGAIKNGGVVPPLGHQRGDWVVEKEPTCTKKGLRTASCTVCGTLLATETIDVSKHVDNDNDGYCDECARDVGDPSFDGDCGCICHKTNPLMKFFYKILRILWKIFHIRQTCYCKAVHY